MKSDKKQLFADIVCFDFIYHLEKKRENSNRWKSCPSRFVKGFCILYTAGRFVWCDRPFYLVKLSQEKWACDFHDDAPPLSFQLQVNEVHC
jgi:hypothetical protein